MQQNLFKAIMAGIFLLFVTFLLIVLLTPILYIKGQGLFETLLSSRELYFALGLSLLTSFLAIILAAIVSLPVGYVLARYDFWGKRFFDILVDLPLILPPLITGLSLLILLGPVLGNYLARIGLRFVFTPLGVIMAQFMVATPFTIRSFKTAFMGIDPVLEQAAMTLGDSEYRVFRRITLPLACNGLLAGITQAWARAVGEFGATVMLAGATRLKTETLPIAVYLNISTGDMDVAISTALIMIVFSVLVLALIKLLEKKGYERGGNVL